MSLEHRKRSDGSCEHRQNEQQLEELNELVIVWIQEKNANVCLVVVVTFRFSSLSDRRAITSSRTPRVPMHLGACSCVRVCASGVRAQLPIFRNFFHFSDASVKRLHLQFVRLDVCVVSVVCAVDALRGSVHAYAQVGHRVGVLSSNNRLAAIRCGSRNKRYGDNLS